MTRRIEIWFTNKFGHREQWPLSGNIRTAFKNVKFMDIAGIKSSLIDVYYFDKDGDVVESKTTHYRCENGKCKKLFA